MADGNGSPSPGELSRSQQRIEAMLTRMEATHEERHEVVLRQVSEVRHRVANLEAERSLSREFFSRVGQLFDRVDALEKNEIAEKAVADFKVYQRNLLTGGSILGAILIGLQIYQLAT
jgi:hypothetical protein